MHDAPALSQLPAPTPIPNSLVAALCTAATQLGVMCDARQVLACTGWGFGIVAAEDWCDPATLLWHPSSVAHVVAPLASTVSYALQRLSALGLQCHDAWFAPSDTHGLAAFVTAGCTAHAVVLLWGCHGPGYTVIGAADDTGVYESTTASVCIPYPQLRARGGIHAICVTRTLLPVSTGLTWHDFVATLTDSRRIDFATPRHPLRDYQTWHVGIGAWDVFALTAEQAAPLALVATHVAQIVHDYAWRMACMHEFIQEWTAIDAPIHMRAMLSEALADCGFFVGILYKQYGHRRDTNALTTSDGALIASVCRDIAATLRDVRIHRVDGQ